MSESELEQFRQQWQREVTSRAGRASAAASSSQPGVGNGSGSTSGKRLAAPAPKVEPRSKPEDESIPGWNFDDLEEREEARKLGESGSGVHPESIVQSEPETALEHYERAVERETQGKLGDSLIHYRKAFKLDDRVDVKYKNKHFPPTAFKPQPSGINNADTNVHATNTAHHSLHGPPGSVSSLVASFAGLPIQGTPPMIERDIPPPCPIASIPQEILSEIILHTAIQDMASFGRLALVCKKLAYLVTTEDSVWKRLVHGPECGIGGMHFTYACTVDGQALRPLLSDNLPDFSSLSLHPSDPNLGRTLSESSAISLTLPLTPQYPTYRYMQQARPRVRFGGLYISTVNYVRAGAAVGTAVTWNNAPVHVVTYYRYLRFFRDGSALSLLTTAEPGDVVPHLKPENVGVGHGAIAAQGGGPGITSVAKYTLRGRWRMSPPEEVRDATKSSLEGEELDGTAEGDAEPGNGKEKESEEEPEGHVYIETHGAAKHYMYTLQLALRGSGGGDKVKNTKLVWRGFWSYNRLTDDWAPFRMKHDRAFVWSRVRSWGDS